MRARARSARHTHRRNEKLGGAHTDAIDARGIRCVRNHRLRQVHLGELRGEQQVLGRDGRAILRGGTQQLLQPAALRVVLHAITRLRDHLLLSVAVERRLGVEAAATLDGAHERRHGAGHGRSHGFSVFVERSCAVETVCRDRAEHTICRRAKRSKVNQPNACGRLQVPRDPAISPEL